MFYLYFLNSKNEAIKQAHLADAEINHKLSQVGPHQIKSIIIGVYLR